MNQPYQADWDFYFDSIEEKIGSFYVDLGLLNTAPIKDKPIITCISLKMNNPREDGLSSSEEFDTLNAIEDRLQELISRDYDAIYAGRITYNSYRKFYFYLGNTMLFDKTISEAMSVFDLYSYDLDTKEDITWDAYKEFLYPTPKQFQIILNRRVVDNLQESGDQLIKGRPVDHWIYFKNSNDRLLFLQKIEHLNFNIINSDEMEVSSNDTEFRLHISRIDNVDLDSVNDYALSLWETANECNGEYDGWETSIEK